MTAAKGSPSGRAGAQAPERARLLTETPKHSDNTALSKALLIAVQQLFGNGLALSVTFGDTSPKGRGFRPRAGEMCSFLFLFVEKYAILVLRPCPPILWEGGEHHESIFISYPVRRSKHNFTLCLQVA